MATPNFKPGIGGLATSRYDFENHIDGYAFNHTANQIELNPPTPIEQILYTNVADALNAISSFIAQTNSTGQGFVSIGDGYDTYHASDSSSALPPNSAFPYDSTTPSLDAALNDLLSNPNNPQHHRIRDGGVVLIKAGTYKISSTVNVPAGIVLLGETYGTKICNAISGGGPLFRIKSDPTRSADAGVDNIKFSFAKETIFFNLTIADNFVEPLYFGDVSYKVPINTSASKPLIIQEPGSFFKLDKCTILGRTVYSGPTLSAVTSVAIGTDTSLPSSTGTHLTIVNSYIDGVSETCQFKSTGFTNDSFICSNNRIRNYGFLNSDISGSANNTFFNINGCNTIISNNYLYGADGGYTNNLLYVDQYPVAHSNYNSQPRITITGNTGVIDKSSAPVSPVNSNLIVYNETSSGINTIPAMVSGNNFESTIDSWFISVAGSGSHYTADFNGVGSIDLAIDYMGSRRTVLVVCDGDYIVTKQGYGNSFSIRGVKNGAQYPNIKISTDTTSFTYGASYTPNQLYTRDRAFFVSGSIEGVKFTYDDSINNSNHLPVIILDDVPLDGAQPSASKLFVRDCSFEDASLLVPDTTVVNNITIENCNFSQTFTKLSNLSLLIPVVKTIKVSGCSFINAIASVSYGSVVFTSENISKGTGADIAIENCNVSYTTAAYSFSTIYGSFLNRSLFFIGNNYPTNFITKTSVNNSSFNFDGITLTVLGLGTYPSYAKIVSTYLNIDKSNFSGATAVSGYTISSINYAIPTLFLEVHRNMNLSETNFFANEFAVQVGGSSFNYNGGFAATTGLMEKNRCSISKCSFRAGPRKYQSCILNFDCLSTSTIQYISGNNYYGARNLVTIDDCYFCNYATDSDNGFSGFPLFAGAGIPNIYPIYTINNAHVETSGISNNYSAVVDIIYGPSATSPTFPEDGGGADVFFTNNTLDFLLGPISTDSAPSYHNSYYGAYVQNNKFQSALPSPSPSRPLTTFSANKISIINNVNNYLNKQSNGFYIDAGQFDFTNNQYTFYNNIPNSSVPEPLASDANDVLYWKFNELGDNITAFSNSGSFGAGSSTNLNFETLASGRSSGNLTPGAETPFQGQSGLRTTGYSRDYVVGAPNQNIDRHSLSGSCWIYLTNYNTVSQHIVGRRFAEDDSWSSPFTFWDFFVGGTNNGALVVSVSYYATIVGLKAVTSFNTTVSNPSFFVPLKQWTHVGFTVSQDPGTFVITAKIYVNGQLAATNTAAANYDGLLFSGDTYEGGSLTVAPGSYFVGASPARSNIHGAETIGATITDLRLANVVRAQSYFLSAYNNLFAAAINGAPNQIPGPKNYLYLWTSNGNTVLNIRNNNFSRKGTALNFGAINLASSVNSIGFIADNAFDSPYINSSNMEEDKIFVNYDYVNAVYGSLPEKLVIDHNIGIYVVDIIPINNAPSSTLVYNQNFPSPIFPTISNTQSNSIDPNLYLIEGTSNVNTGAIPSTKWGSVSLLTLNETSGSGSISFNETLDLNIPPFAKIKNIEVNFCSAYYASGGTNTITFSLAAILHRFNDAFPQASTQGNTGSWLQFSGSTSGPGNIVHQTTTMQKMRIDFTDTSLTPAPNNKYEISYQGHNSLGHFLLNLVFNLNVTASFSSGTRATITLNYIKVKYTF